MDTSSTGVASLYETLLALLPNLWPGHAAGTGTLEAARALFGAHGLVELLPAALIPGAARSADASGPDSQARPSLQPSSATRPTLTVHLLDGLQVLTGAGVGVELPHGKVRSLFKLLLLHRRRAMPRAKLCAALWPDADALSARNSLNVTVHRLRRALRDPDLVQHTDAGYQLRPDPELWLDAERFLVHAALGALEESDRRPAGAIAQYEAAAALYRTDLMDDGDDEPALAADAQALSDRLNQILDSLARLLEDSGDLHGCLRAAHRHLALDECNEVTHRRLMRCYARLGQPQLAERQYRNCVAALKTQLGIHPQPQTTELCHKIGRGLPG